jgi:hypothetical protein
VNKCWAKDEIIGKAWRRGSKRKKKGGDERNLR